MLAFGTSSYLSGGSSNELELKCYEKLVNNATNVLESADFAPGKGSGHFNGAG